MKKIIENIGKYIANIGKYTKFKILHAAIGILLAIMIWFVFTPDDFYIVFFLVNIWGYLGFIIELFEVIDKKKKENNELRDYISDLRDENEKLKKLLEEK